MTKKILKPAFVILKLALTLLIPTANLVVYYVYREHKTLGTVFAWLSLLTSIAVVILFTCLVKFKRMKLYYLFSLVLGFFATWFTADIVLKLLGLWGRGPWFGGYALEAAFFVLIFNIPLAILTLGAGLFIWYKREKKRKLILDAAESPDDIENEKSAINNAEQRKETQS